MIPRAIDAHAHLPLDVPRAARFYHEHAMRVINIAIDSAEFGGLDAQRESHRELHEHDPSHFSWVTSFTVSDFGSADWTERVIAGLDADFARGAIGCKVWKNIGMELRDADGSFVFVDDARFAPIFEYLQKLDRPLLMHIAEPTAAWSALDPRSPHYDYYSTHPLWHWHGRADVPSHERLIASRDVIVERYPRLRVVGLHYGSQEHDLAGVAARLTRHPNYYVDTAARLGDMILQASSNHRTVRELHERFADRIIWGVDLVCTRRASTMTEEQIDRLLALQSMRYALEERFFTTGDVVTDAANTAEGLMLDARTIDALFRDNAMRVYGVG